MRDEHDRGAAGRFAPGLPRISDGQLLFLQHMLAHVKEPAQGGSRVAIIMNGSPLFTGDAGSGESEIRRWILENDLLEALIALPEQLFYNTGIATYVLGNSRTASGPRAAARFNSSMPRRSGPCCARAWAPSAARSLSAGSKTFYGCSPTSRTARPARSTRTATSARPSSAGVYPTTHFGFRKITVERPLRLDFQASPERIARLDDQRAFANLAVSRKRGEAKARDEEAGRKQQAAIRTLLRSLPDRLFLDRAVFENELVRVARKAEPKFAAPIRKAILSALAERNPNAEICRDRDGRPEPDPELRDTENVPLSEDVESFFEREVKPPRSPTPGSIRTAGIRKTERSGSSATRSTSTAISTNIAHPARSRRSKPTSSEWRRRSWTCCRRCRADGAPQPHTARHRKLRADAGERGSAQDAGAGQPSDRSRSGAARRQGRCTASR